MKEDWLSKGFVGALTLLSVCHTVVTDEEGSYNASSPDELALISFASDIGGFQYIGKNDEQVMEVKIKETGEVL